MAKLKLYLDIRHVSVKTNQSPIKVMLSHRTRSAYISIDISIEPKYWDSEKQKVKDHPRRKSINDDIQKKLVPMKAALQEVEACYDISTMDINELRDRMMSIVNGDRINVDESNNVANVFARVIELQHGRTKQLYELTWKKISQFDPNSSHLRFDDITVDWLKHFDAHLSKTAPSANARAIDMRNLRAVINYAIDNEITTKYAFRRFKIKHEETKKRSFDAETLRAIFNSESLDPWMEKYRDLFKLIFMLRGINIIDLCHLDTIHQGRVEYRRSKTKKMVSIKLETEILALITKYRGKNQLLNYMDTNKNYRCFYFNACKGLRAIKDRLNETKEVEIEALTTYWARHTWATIAAYLDIPKETIAASLSHSARTVTDIYIDFDWRKVDEANRRVLNFVLYGYEGGYPPKEE